MIKINDLQKKIIKISIVISLVMISSFFLINNVKAEELSDFCEYTNPCLSTENISTLTTSENYLIVLGDGYPTPIKLLTVININTTDYENNKFYISKGSDNRWYFLYEGSRSSALTGKVSHVEAPISLTSTFNDIYSNKNLSGGQILSYSDSYYAYYSTVDLYDENGNLVFKAGLHNEEEEDDGILHINVDYDSDYVTNNINRNSKNLDLAKQLAKYYDKLNFKYSITINDTFVNFILYENATYTELRSYFGGGANNKLEGKPDNTSYKVLQLHYQNDYILENLIDELDNKDFTNSTYFNSFNSGIYIYGSDIPTKTFNLYEDTFKDSDNPFSWGWGFIIYSTNLDYIKLIHTDESKFLPVSFNNGEIHYSGDYFLTYEQVMFPTPSYEFNEDIDVTDISKIKIKFKLPEDTSNLEVDINWTFDNLIDGGDGLFTTPYLEFKHSNGDVTVSQSMDTLNGGHWFSDNYLSTLLPDSDITEISLVVDVVNATGLLNANFSSKFPYSISYEYIEEVEDYFITIDMDDYASISLIPKVYDIESEVSSSISSPIYKYGVYDIEIWEDLATKTVINRWDNHSTSFFVYPMYSGYKNCVIHFIKKEVDASDRYIRFDSRYYSYVVKNYLNEEVTILNPNTGEDMTIPDTSDLYKYDSPVDSRFSFNSFLKPIKFIFESITNFYNNYCPEIVQYFFYLIFAFFVILVLIRIFL